MIWYDMIWFDVTWYDMIWFGTPINVLFFLAVVTSLAKGLSDNDGPKGPDGVLASGWPPDLWELQLIKKENTTGTFSCTNNTVSFHIIVYIPNSCWNMLKWTIHREISSHRLQIWWPGSRTAESQPLCLDPQEKCLKPNPEQNHGCQDVPWSMQIAALL